MRFLDTNILLRYLTRDDELKAQAAYALLKRVEAGLETVTTSPLVIFEAIFTLARTYHQPKQRVAELVLPIIALRRLKLPDKRVWRDAMQIWTTTSIEFADAYNAAYMQAHGMSEVYTWDEGFDQVQGITRIDVKEGVG